METNEEITAPPAMRMRKISSSANSLGSERVRVTKQVLSDIFIRCNTDILSNAAAEYLFSIGNIF